MKKLTAAFLSGWVKWGILVVYFLLLYILWQRTGIIEVNEAEKYLSASKQLRAEFSSKPLLEHLFYSSYVLFLFVFSFFNNNTLIIFVQICLSIYAAFCIEKTTTLFTSKKEFGLLSFILFLFCIPIQVWTLTFFSDSFFVSLTFILLYFTVKEEKSKMHFLLWFLVAVLVTFARPPGVFFVICFGAYLFSFHNILKPYLINAGLIISLSIVLIFLFNVKVETKGYIKPIVAGAIIVDQPDYDIPAFNNKEKSSLKEAYAFLLKEKGAGHITYLYEKKIVSFFTLTRNYYSTFHNLAASLFYLVYLFALIGIYFLFRSKKTTLLLLLLLPLLLTANLTGLTYNEWHYRFTAPVLPLLLIIAIIGLKESGLNKKTNYK